MRTTPLYVAAAMLVSANLAAQPADEPGPPGEGSATPHSQPAEDVGVDEPREARHADSDHDLQDRAHDAIMFPAHADRIRSAGIDAEVVRDLIVEMQENGEDADGMTAALDALEEAATGGATPQGELGAFVRARLDEGVRGRALAEAIRTERGSGSGQGRPEHADHGRGRPDHPGSGAGRPEHADGRHRGPERAGSGHGRPENAETERGRPENAGSPHGAPANAQGGRPENTGAARHGRPERPGSGDGELGTAPRHRGNGRQETGSGRAADSPPENGTAGNSNR